MKASSAKAKGREWENKIAEFFRSEDFPDCERDPRRSMYDKADITGLPHLAIQAKATTTWGDIGTALSDVDKQAVNRSTETKQFTLGVVFKKKAGKSKASDGVVIMTPEMFVTLYKGWLESL